MKRFLQLIAITLLLISCSQKENTMIVSGKIDGLKKGRLYLQKITDSSLVAIDSAEIRGEENFVFEYNLTHPELFYLYLDKADNNSFNDRIAFFGEKGNINITTSWNQFEIDAKITGSKSHDTYNEYRKMITNFIKKDLELAQRFSSEADSLKADSIATLAELNYVSKYRYILNFALNNLGSYVTPYITITDGVEVNPIYLDSIFSSLPDSIANSKYGKRLEKLVKENTKKN